MSVREYLDARARLVEHALDACTGGDPGPFGRLQEAMRYSLLAGGKRVRPVLAIAACEAVGGTAETAMPVACALELAHTYTLIHDDLPAMDDDDFRRGRPTNHKVFGEAQALLAGCGLLSLAFEIVARATADGLFPADRAARIVALLADAIGWRGVIGGQSLDIESTGKTVDIERVTLICRMKTAVLISASVRAGAIAAGAPRAKEEALARFGDAIGLAFQIADDVLNVTGDAEKLGKGTGTDAEAGKTTFPALLGLDGARRRAAERLDTALAEIAGFGAAAKPLRDLARYIVNRDR
ncbi:polyprenyl synthetase family protein [bacterium]|nr:polyprenyl synthetase family protein [bacterium]